MNLPERIDFSTSTARQRLRAGMLHIALLLTLAGCGGPSSLAPQVAGDGVDLAPPQINRVQAQRSEYRIAPDDIIEVSVYQVNDLNRTVQVDGGGRITLPLIGAVQASGRTVRELEQEIATKLKARYLQSPQVAIFLKEATGQRVTLEGAVRKPGVIQAKGDMTLLQAVASAEGFSETADTSKVYVSRQTEKGRMAAQFDASAIRSGAAADPKIYGGDTIIVEDSGSKMAWKYFREAVPTAGIFRPW